MVRSGDLFPDTALKTRKLYTTQRRQDTKSARSTPSSDRHRGGGHPPTPATPPCVRVRTRRFEAVTLTLLNLHVRQFLGKPGLHAHLWLGTGGRPKSRSKQAHNLAARNPSTGCIGIAGRIPGARELHGLRFRILGEACQRHKPARRSRELLCRRISGIERSNQVGHRVQTQGHRRERGKIAQ